MTHFYETGMVEIFPKSTHKGLRRGEFLVDWPQQIDITTVANSAT
jgi:hypothetical protein